MQISCLPPNSSSKPNGLRSIGLIQAFSNSPLLILMNPYKNAKLLFHLTFWPLFLAYLALAFPIAGMYVFDYFTNDIIDQCGRTTEGLPKAPCYYNGADVAGISRSYIGSAFLLGILNPIIAFKAISALIPAYLLWPWVALVCFGGIQLARLKRASRA